MATAANAPNTTNTSTTPIKIFTSALVPEVAADTACGGGAYAAGGAAAEGAGAPAGGAVALAGGASPTRVPHVTQNACPSPNAVPQFRQKPAMDPAGARRFGLNHL